jgi:cyclopropane fatty-acyl-phospholipid synthase-like methyltransferase
MSNARFHSHSMPAAVGLARNADFSGVRRLLDIAGGSGCYSIQLALHNPELRCTVADLPPVAADTATYIQRYGVGDRVDTVSFNMFDDAWSRGYDAIFFSNIYHDWDARRRADLSRSAFEALPSGGRILLHEMLLADGQDGPLPAALFSVMMLNTRGKQFSFLELASELGAAGFREATVQHTYGYYSLVSATKP